MALQEKAAARYTAFREKYGLREEKGSKGSSTPSGGASRNSFMSTPGMPFTIPESGEHGHQWHGMLWVPPGKVHAHHQDHSRGMELRQHRC